jgi:penicillin V acylase-like amidase (Ntn superfamily)
MSQQRTTNIRAEPGKEALMRRLVVVCVLLAGGCAPAGDAPDGQLAAQGPEGAGCSAATFMAGGNTIFAANLDYVNFCRGQIFINPLGLHKTGVIPGTTGVNAEWSSKYASVTFNFVGYQIAWAGMNEAGLVMSTMSLNQTELPRPDPRPVLDSGNWIQYLLDTCATVDEVLAADDLVRNLTVDHYLVADRSGAAATIEFLDGELVAHTGGDLPVSVLTNSPYSELLSQWQIHGGSGDYGGMDSSSQRFCIAADRVTAFDGTSAEEGVAYAFQTLQAIAGQRFSEHTSQWRLVFDTGALRAYFKTDDDRTLRWVDLEAFNPWCGQPVQMLDIHARVSGDAASVFHDYSHAEALDQMLWFIDFWPGVEATPTSASQLLRYYESFACESRPLVRQGARRVRPVAQ